MIARQRRVADTSAALQQRRAVSRQRLVERDRCSTIIGRRRVVGSGLPARELLRLGLRLPEIQDLLAVRLQAVVVGGPQRLLPALAITETDARGPRARTVVRLAIADPRAASDLDEVGPRSCGELQSCGR